MVLSYTIIDLGIPNAIRAHLLDADGPLLIPKLKNLWLNVLVDALILLNGIMTWLLFKLGKLNKTENGYHTL